MTLFKDIIWDFDGTLFDTYPGIVGSFIKALKDYDIEETYEDIINYFKISESIAIAHYSEIYGLDDVFIDKFKAYKKDMKIEEARPFPFSEEVCRQIDALGGRNYIITHRGATTLKYLQHYRMADFFTEVVTKQNGFKRKPDPEAFTYLIEKYNMDKSTAMVIGDRECEILGGKAAGIKTCLYNTNNVSLSVEPDFYVESLKDLLHIVKEV